MGIDYYDREIIDEAAKASGLAVGFINANEQSINTSLLFSIATGTIPLDAQVYNAQREAIVKFAEKSSCVIVGRCADYILKDHDGILRCFIYADMESRIWRAVNDYGMSREKAEKNIRQSDKKRSNHYRIYTEQTWGSRKNYDLLMNSNSLGIELSSRLIIEAVNK